MNTLRLRDYEKQQGQSATVCVLLIVPVFMISWRSISCALLAQDLLSHFPFVTRDFQQIVFLTDSSSLSLKDEVNSFLNNSRSTISSFGSPLIVEFRWTTVKNVSLVDILNNFGENLETVVFIRTDKITPFVQMLDDILEELTSYSYSNNSGSSAKWKDAHWNPFYFFVWPNSHSKNDSADFEHFRSYLEKFSSHIPLNADVFWIRENNSVNKNQSSPTSYGNVSDSSTHMIWESYFVKENNFVQEISISVKHLHFIWQLKKFKWHRRGNFSGAKIVATGVSDPIYAEEVRFRTNINKTVELDGGMAVAIFRTFAYHLKFSEVAIIGAYMLDGAENAEYDGMEIQLDDGRADISITESALTDDKAVVVQFLHATTANWLEARISEVPSSKNFFFSPFSYSVWTTTGIYFLILILCIRFYRWATEKHRLENPEIAVNELGKKWHFLNRLSNVFGAVQLDFIWALGTLCQQGWYDWPKQTPIKILILVASMTGFLLYAAYSAVITSKLSVKDPITVTFDKLLNKSYTFYLENDFNFPADISERPDIRINTLFTLEDAGSAVVNISGTKSALVSYSEFFNAARGYANYTAAESCSLFTTIRVSVRPNLCAMSVKKLSPFKEIFNVKTVYIWERGILRRILNDYQSRTQLRCESDTYTLVPQTMTDLFVAFATIGYGTLTSVCLICLEISIKLYFKFIYQPVLT